MIIYVGGRKGRIKVDGVQMKMKKVLKGGSFQKNVFSVCDFTQRVEIIASKGRDLGILGFGKSFMKSFGSILDIL